jgi:pantetheine-phosphate adenylyltransferase
MRKAVYAGTFDPFTNGHMDIVLRARKLFDEIILLVAVPPTKNPFLEAQERLSLIEDLFKNDKGIKVEKWAGLVVDFAKKIKSTFLLEV